MSNSLLTINMITREAIRLWKNSNAFIQNVDTQYDETYAKSGAKQGTALRIRLPNDFTVRTGAAASVQDTSEQSTTLVLATQKGVDVSFSQAERTMSLDDYSRRIMAPMVNNLAGAVAVDVMSGVEGGVSNYVANVDGGTGLVIAPTSQTILRGGAALDNNSTPIGRWCATISPNANADIVSALTGLFNPQSKLSDQYRTGMMQKNTLRFDWFSDQTIINHTTATYTVISGTNTCATVNGANQTGLAITTTAITGGLAQGEIVNLEGVNAVNRITKASIGTRRQFVVTAPVATGGTSVPIYPALIPASGGVSVQFQTVDVSPANGADLDVVTLPAEVYTKNIQYAPDAVTMATADLEMPKGVHEAARESFDGISMRMITDYNVLTDQMITRLDVLYGFLWVRPEWAVVLASPINA